MRTSHWRAAAAVAIGLTVAACSGGSATPTVASRSTGGEAGASTQTPLAQAQAYSQCIRSHGVPNFPDPVVTPSGGSGYRTSGIDGKSATFQAALQACRDLPSPWNDSGKELSPADQQAWLRWAACVRTHGVPDLPDPTFAGEQVRLGGATSGDSPQLRSAMNACKAQLPSTGGLGG